MADLYWRYYDLKLMLLLFEVLGYHAVAMTINELTIFVPVLQSLKRRYTCFA